MSRLEQRLERLADRPKIGRPIRFYLRRREQLLYLVVGGWNTAFGYAIWAVLQYLLGDTLHYLVIVLISWPIAVLNAYVGYRYVVFRSRGPIRKELPRFSMVYVGGLVANLLLLPVALVLLPFSIYVVQALFMTGVIVASYVAHKYYSFGGDQHRDSGPTHAYDRPAISKD
jgi:putative flippase GtrA